MIIESVPDAVQLRDHWWWRPGWSVGSRHLAWHLTFEGPSDLDRLVRELQSPLARFGTLDPVPAHSLHLTLAAIAPASDINEDRVDAMARSMRSVLAGLPPLRLRFERILLLAESVCLIPEPVAEIAALRERVAMTVEDVVWGRTAGEADHGFLPHLSIAYVNGPQAGVDVLRALSEVETAPALGVAPTLTLVEIHRDNGFYEWRTMASVPV